MNMNKPYPSLKTIEAALQKLDAKLVKEYKSKDEWELEIQSSRLKTHKEYRNDPARERYIDQKDYTYDIYPDRESARAFARELSQLLKITCNSSFENHGTGPVDKHNGVKFYLEDKKRK